MGDPYSDVIEPRSGVRGFIRLLRWFFGIGGFSYGDPRNRSVDRG